MNTSRLPLNKRFRKAFSTGKHVFVVIILLIQWSCKSPEGSHSSHEYTNALAGSSSPYLLQHAHNPVNWYPWNEEALAEADKSNKMLIISIGYAACHWCHVMERESFEDTAVARLMNEHFINIKVDREERPDVDDVYMTACQLASGRGCGWPLNAFALPDGRPVWAGTYFPKDDWLNILNEFIRLQDEEPDKLEEFAEHLTEGFGIIDEFTSSASEVKLSDEEMQLIGQDFYQHMDTKHGGRKGVPKFPLPNNFEFLLRFGDVYADEDVLGVTKTTLDKMMEGGIYDHLGGGFARYSTDGIWRIPHFEKMLYDNGQLMRLYALGYKRFADPAYVDILEETFEWMQREMLDKNEGFYSSLDADTEGEEGKFYIWSQSEIQTLIPDSQDLEIFEYRYKTTEQGNWEDKKNVLHAHRTIPETAEKFELPVDQVVASLDRTRESLFEARAKRPRPALDNKIILSWNALTVDGLLEAYEATGDERYKDQALKTLEFLLSKMQEKDGRVWRTYAEGKASINGFLDDYATLGNALIHAYEVTFEEEYLTRADQLVKYVDKHFGDNENPMYYYTSDLDPPLVTRKKDWTDNVIPSSNSMYARLLHDLGLYLYQTEYLDKAESMLGLILPKLREEKQPQYYSNWCQLFFDFKEQPYEIAILGDEALAYAAELQSMYLPNCKFLGGKTEGNLELLKDKLNKGETTIYVCQNKVCKLPVYEVEKAIPLIQ